ncbi:MAG: hypothetical protein DMG14_15940 [Acidobacteria bacterium]|nr:MAG: hypothetical protein DMG14_15940 [Acidobacteriota bacterium]
MRASQINGCSLCVEGGTRHAKSAGGTDERFFASRARSLYTRHFDNFQKMGETYRKSIGDE